ncbi:hypothetical protein SAMN06296036_1114 [Pseudobacteriovorax antillogorgiicola]|uniref:Uncharacterized protein n=2 Tax=Pseudobacteriovorax antillogorgiicola TaxID=1513793 RepID=A0A1Y6C406_9BACT|nr:hypothetical protein EDD56_111174 [Pseudobacteriovorax antillogorgiicola]SMF36124.1 hypothetical protein SAMN06296036_1114 [Pseudobacteriovorax antillogorgiicola]
MILGGDLFSLIAAQVLEKLGYEVIWVSSRLSQQTNYGQEINRTVTSHPRIAEYLSYLSTEDPFLATDHMKERVKVIESASLLNFLDNGSFVDVRLKVQNKVHRYRPDYLIATNRFFNVQKKLRIPYEPSPWGDRLQQLSVSRCHMLGEVSFLYFKAEQIDAWFDQLNHFIKSMRYRTKSKRSHGLPWSPKQRLARNFP